VILGLVVAVHVRDECVDPKGPYIYADKLHTIGRMNGLGNYIKTRDAFFQIERMSFADWKKRNTP
jgi:flavin reductase (DIM6/NTAB) family NADH-FMN oxidoreductase RutF